MFSETLNEIANENQLSPTDRMFKELGYKKFEGLRTIDFYNGVSLIQFDKDCKVVHINKNEETDFITMQELQSINKKVEELGWKI